MPVEQKSDLVQFFVSALYAPAVNQQELQQMLCDAFGVIEQQSAVFEFDQSDSYLDEMGPNLKRIFFPLKSMRPAGDLVIFKKDAGQLEDAFFRAQGKRLVNLDPGYLDEAKVVVASRKKAGHKIFLADGVYADMVYHYHEGIFQSFEWSRPDYKSAIYTDFLLNLRKSYLQKNKLF